MSGEYGKVEAELNARGYTRMVFDLARIEALLDLLGSPQRAYPAIHLTGTNGKTSTARMIDSLLRAHGLRTGTYTSPHLETVRERISIDGAPVSEETFVEIYREVAPAAQFLDQRGAAESLTYFDVTTAMALAAFADAPVDVAVVEVGLGGAEDSTNVLQANTCVITPIGLDHTEWLGETVEEIATAKAGIVHSGATLICATQPDEAVAPILERCAEVGATIAREGSEFGVVRRGLAVGGQVLSLQGLGGLYDDVFLPLHGAHQAQNAAVALAAVEAFLGAGASTRQLDPEVVREGLVRRLIPRAAGARAYVSDDPARCGAQPARDDGDGHRPAGGVRLQPAHRGRRRPGRQRCDDHPGAAGTRRRRDRLYAEHVASCDARRRARCARRRHLRGVPGPGGNVHAGCYRDRGGACRDRCGGRTLGCRRDCHRVGGHGVGRADVAREMSDHEPRSGLRNPPAAVRGVGAAALGAEGLVLLLGIQPMRVLGVHLTGVAIGVIVTLAIVCFILAGLLRRPWAWYVASALQVLVFACGFVFHTSLAVLGVLFGLLWIYVLYVRRSVLG